MATVPPTALAQPIEVIGAPGEEQPSAAGGEVEPVVEAATARDAELWTVEAMPHGLQTKHQNRTLLASLGDLGRISDDIPSPAESAIPVVRFAQPRHVLMFPCGAETRVVDAQGRIKVGSTTASEKPALCDLLGWAAGGLDLAMIDGWGVITQPAHRIGVKPLRGSCSPSLTDTPMWRIQFRRAHMTALGVAQTRCVLVAPVPAAGALVVVSPNAALAASAPPAHVLTVLTDSHPTGTAAGVEQNRNAS